MQKADYKKIFINVLIASLIGAAAVGVIAVLAGGFNDTLDKTLFTLAMVAIHALAALGYLDTTTKQPSKENLDFFNNTFFVLIIMSFFTSVFGIWGIISGDIVAKLYLTYGVALFATLHGEVLANTTGEETRTDNLVYANYIFMVLVILLIMPLIWLSKDIDFGDVYYRILAAAAIVDFTLTALVAIFHKLYLQKHPKADSSVFTQVLDPQGKPVLVAQGQPKRHLHPLIWVLIIFLGAQVVVPLLFLITSFTLRR